MDFDDRAAIFLRAADLLAGPWRDTLNGATMLGQAKTVQQAEIDAACELIDFLRFNVAFARQILADQPISSPGVWNRTDYRPLDGFVYAITPFNFTAIGGNLATAPALMGNTVIWKPSPTQQLAAHYTYAILEAAGLPPGVINLLPGDGIAVSDVALRHPDFAGHPLHRFDGHLPAPVAEHRRAPHRLPLLPADRGGDRRQGLHPGPPQRRPGRAAHRDDPRLVRVLRAEVLGRLAGVRAARALEHDQGRPGRADRCACRSATSATSTNFTSAVIDERAFAKHRDALDRARSGSSTEIVAGGTVDDSVGWFVRPTVIVSDDPRNEIFTTEYFGPILGVYVYEDADFEAVMTEIDTGGAVRADRRGARRRPGRAGPGRRSALRFAAGNFYLNDKPTGAVVGQQPFGGARASGTNDKAGSMWNLIRWASPRSIKETLVPPTDHGYPHTLMVALAGTAPRTRLLRRRQERKERLSFLLLSTPAGDPGRSRSWLLRQPVVADLLLGPEAGQDRRRGRLLELLAQQRDGDLELAGQLDDGAADRRRRAPSALHGHRLPGDGHASAARSAMPSRRRRPRRSPRRTVSSAR